MQLLILTATLLVLTVIGFYLGRTRATAAVSGRTRVLHSLPSYYGYYVAVWCAIPALLILMAWLIGEQQIIQSLLVSSLPENVRSLPPERISLVAQRREEPGERQRLEPGRGSRTAAGRRLLHPSGTDQPHGDDRSVLAAAIAGLVYARARSRRSCGPATRRSGDPGSADRLLDRRHPDHVGIILSLIFEASRFFLRVSPSTFCSAWSGARRWRCAPTRSARPAFRRGAAVRGHAA